MAVWKHALLLLMTCVVMGEFCLYYMLLCIFLNMNTVGGISNSFKTKEIVFYFGINTHKILISCFIILKYFFIYLIGTITYITITHTSYFWQSIPHIKETRPVTHTTNYRITCKLLLNSQPCSIEKRGTSNMQ